MCKDLRAGPGLPQTSVALSFSLGGPGREASGKSLGPSGLTWAGSRVGGYLCLVHSWASTPGIGLERSQATGSRGEEAAS